MYEGNCSLENGKSLYRPNRSAVFDTEGRGKVHKYSFFEHTFSITIMNYFKLAVTKLTLLTKFKVLFYFLKKRISGKTVNKNKTICSLSYIEDETDNRILIIPDKRSFYLWLIGPDHQSCNFQESVFRRNPGIRVSQGPPCIYHYVFLVYSFFTFDNRVRLKRVTLFPTIAFSCSSKS